MARFIFKKTGSLRKIPSLYELLYSCGMAKIAHTFAVYVKMYDDIAGI